MKEGNCNQWDGFSVSDKQRFVNSGLSENGRPKKHVIVVGAGMAGLVAALELSKAGHRVDLLEAQCRVGGRVWTMREPFADGLYAEAGAMRLPKSHALTHAYVALAGLESELADFEMSSSNAMCYLNGKRYRFSDYEKDPDVFEFGTRRRQGDSSERLQLVDKPAPGNEGSFRTAKDLWGDVMRGIRSDKRFFRDGKPLWEALLQAFDHFSTIEFLESGGVPYLNPNQRQSRKARSATLFEPWTYEEIIMFGQMENQYARLNNSIVSLVREYVESPLDGSERYSYITGGTDRLPRWFFGKLKDNIILGACVEEIGQKTSDGEIFVRYRAADQYEHRELSGNHLVLAVPFTVLRHMRGIEGFSPEKRRAIQALNYSAAGKIFLQCRKRFWEHEPNPVFGGRSQTDLPLRSIWYPHHCRESERGVLLASYTWGRDAERWGHFLEHDRIRRAIGDLNELFRNSNGDKFVIPERLVEGGVSVMWQNQEFAGGAFALFNPQQETIHRESIRQIEGLSRGEPKIHFAGEHTCPAYHRWIEGAVDSGLRAAWEVHESR